MTNFSTGDFSQTEPPKRSRRKAKLGCGVVLGLLLLLVLIPTAAWIVSSRRASDDLATQLAKVRARGEPLTTVELNDFYQPAIDRPDMTPEIMTALDLCGADDLKPLATGLPIVGIGPEPPPVSELWPQLTDVEAYLARQAPALATFHEVARRDGTARFPVDFSLGVATLLPQTQAMRHGARVLSLQFHVDLHRGRTSDAVECILAQIALARGLDQEPLLISQLVRLALVGMAVGNSQALVRQAEIDLGDLVRLQEGLRKIGYLPSLKRALAGERAIGYTACIDSRSFAENAPPVTPEEARQIAQRPPQRVRDAAKMLDLNLRMTEAADESLLAVRRESARFEVETQELSKGMVNKMFYALTLLLHPAYNTAVNAIAHSAAKRDCADVALAGEQYRRQYGEWPRTLEQLVPEFLPAVPVDPFSGVPLKIAVTAGEFKVYSVGKDEENNHGNLSDRDQPHTDTGFVIPTERAKAR